MFTGRSHNGVSGDSASDGRAQETARSETGHRARSRPRPRPETFVDTPGRRVASMTTFAHAPGDRVHCLLEEVSDAVHPCCACALRRPAGGGSRLSCRLNSLAGPGPPITVLSMTGELDANTQDAAANTPARHWSTPPGPW
ncbi:hypothetical protein PSA01_65400 [Pseudonocardia saturnea]|uniref:Uncharacterized protein n=1 Tax=Pseudonocardia saturnea TaxID=33909 RepID=A0ABQ0S9A9_9PSEU|nr:hypothetical protein Pdca_15510 [Pseudonocardia autotrophica]GEC29511.1 hypothetical protein PSA01_65400 [Pseudonocardia saturnea]